IKIDRRFSSSGNTAQAAAAAVMLPVGALMRSGFENIPITGIDLNVVSSEGKKTAQLQRVAVDKMEAKPGDTVEVQAFVRSDAGQVLVQKIPVKIPADTPTGALLIAVADGGSLEELSAAKSFVPRNLAELIGTLNRVKKDDRLYVETYRVTNGAVIGSSEM